MAKALDESIVHLNEGSNSTIYHVPCLAHVIQLAVKAFTDKLKATATNEQLEKSITDEQVNSVKGEKKEFYLTLSKVSDTLFKCLISLKLAVCSNF